jgi:hypothetical protein
VGAGGHWLPIKSAGVLGLFGFGWHYEYLGFGGWCCDCVDDRLCGVGVVGECGCLFVVVADLFGGFG